MSKNDTARTTPPFSYPVKVANISANAVAVRLQANAGELRGLAELWRVLEVQSLEAELQISRWKKDGVRVKGHVRAKIVQACVVTLEPIESRIGEDFEQIFVPEGSKLARIVTTEAAEMVLDPEGPDLPEAFAGDTIYVGEVVSEFAALAIDPYPRKAGIGFTDHVEGDVTEKTARPNPFAILKDWKKD